MHAHLTEAEELEFAKRYPGAYAYIVHKNLAYEIKTLRAERDAGIAHPGRKSWVYERLEQLETWFKE